VLIDTQKDSYMLSIRHLWLHCIGGFVILGQLTLEIHRNYNFNQKIIIRLEFDL